MLHVLSLLVLSLCAQETPAGAGEKVRSRLEDLVKAMAAKDGKAAADCFNVARMVRELEIWGFWEKAAGPADHEKRARVIENALPRIATSSPAFAKPEKIRTLHVQFKRGGTEAEALCRLTLTGTKTKVRFWLVREEDKWQIYDFEMTEANIRLTIMLAAIGGMKEDRPVVLKTFQAIRLALAQITEGESEAAHQTLQKALQAQPPAMLAAWLELVDASVLLALGDHEDAMKAADRALAQQKDLYVALGVKAQALFELEKFEACLESAREFLKQAGDDADTWLLVGNALDRLKKTDDAVQAYRKGAASDEEEFANRLQLGRLLVSGGKPAEARKSLTEASRNAPTDEEVFGEAAELLDGAGEFAGVLEIAEDHLRRAHEDSAGYVWQGRALRKLKRFAEAEKALRSAVEKDKDDAELEDELVFTLAQSGKDREALERAEKVAAEDEGRAHYLRAFSFAASGKPEPALGELAKYLDAVPSGFDALEKDSVFEGLKKGERFTSLIAQAKATHQFMQDVQKFEEQHDWEGMLKRSTERAAAAPDGDRAHFYRGYALRRLGRFADAELALKAAIGKTRSKTGFRDELGKALAAQGKLDEALALADELLANKAEEDGLYLRVAAYAMVKKPEDAIKALGELLGKHPDAVHLLNSDPDLEEFRKQEAVRALLKKAEE
jgi:tetratricopeptide (TPR) repeat protein